MEDARNNGMGDLERQPPQVEAAVACRIEAGDAIVARRVEAARPWMVAAMGHVLAGSAERAHNAVDQALESAEATDPDPTAERRSRPLSDLTGPPWSLNPKIINAVEEHAGRSLTLGEAARWSRQDLEEAPNCGRESVVALYAAIASCLAGDG